DLPRVVEGMPDGPADRVARRPRILRIARIREGSPVHPRIECIEHCCSEAGHARLPIACPLRRPRAQLPKVGFLGLEHVLDDLLEVSTATARTLAELDPFCRTRGPVEGRPGCLEKRYQPFQLAIFERAIVVRPGRGRN